MDKQRTTEFHRTPEVEAPPSQWSFISSLSHAAKSEDGIPDSHKLIIYTAKGLAVSVYAFILASAAMLFGVAPMGLALLCSQDKRIGFIYIGAAASALSVGGEMTFILLLAYTMVFVVRAWLVLNGRRFDFLRFRELFFPELIQVKSGYRIAQLNKFDRLRIKVAIAAIASIFVSVVMAVSSGFTIFSFISGLFLLVSAIGFTFVMAGTSTPIRSSSSSFAGAGSSNLHRECAEGVLLFGLVFALNEYSFLGFNFALVACAFACFWAAKQSDMMRAGVVGLICGIAVSTSAAPLFAIVGLAAGAGSKINEKLMIPLGVLAGGAYLFYLHGMGALHEGLADILTGALIFLPVLRLIDKRQEDVHEAAKNGIAAELLTQKELYKADANEILTISSTFGQLGEMFDSLSETLRLPERHEVDQIARSSCNEVCSDCATFALCYGRVKDSSFERLVRSGVRMGHVTKKDLPGVLLDNCEKLDTITTKINTQLATLTSRRRREDKTTAFASGYTSLAKVLEDKQRTQASENTQDQDATDKVQALLQEKKLKFDSVSVFGARLRRLVICGVDAKLAAFFYDSCLADLESLLGCRLSDATIEQEGGYYTLTATSVAKFTTEFHYSAKNKKGERMCGDTIHTFSADSYFYTMLADGMGSGREAALVSRITCAFAEKLTECGGSLTSTVESINNFIMTQNFECSSTIDLLQLDLQSGEANFIKSGAAPSLIVRGGSVYKVSSKSMPIGLTKECNAELITMPLEDGDIVVMISDGVASDFESSLWLAKFVCAKQDEGVRLDELSKHIIEHATDESRRPDDMTVGLVRVKLKA